jgi:hypothetical protein
MSKLLDLGTVSEETKGNRIGGPNQDGSKTSCAPTLPNKFYMGTNTGSIPDPTNDYPAICTLNT